MGNQQSPQVTEYPVNAEELRNAPHNLYLVFGRPSIQYTHDRVRGPLIYDVDVAYDDDEEREEHAATIDLTCAVPRRQKFELIRPQPSSSSPAPAAGLALTFRIAATKPARRVRVLTDVAVAYRPGEGLRFSAATTDDNRNKSSHNGTTTAPASADPHCVFDTDDTSTLEVVVTDGGVVPRRLRPVAWAEAPHPGSATVARRVIYAPLVIEVDAGEAEEPPSQPARPPAAAATSTDTAAPPALASAAPSASPAPSPPTPPQQRHVRHYTLLELPAEATTARDGEAMPERVTCTVCKQLLQVESEVYDLEDVFDVGRDEDAVHPQAEPDEDDDLCVVCLTNSKDTTILPCRHMCLCSECAMHLRLSNNRCPLCRGNIDRLMTL